MNLNKLTIYKISQFLIILALMLIVSNANAIHICPITDSTKSNSLWISKDKDYLFDNSEISIFKVKNGVVEFVDNLLKIDDYLFYYDIVNKDKCKSRFIDIGRSVYCIKDSIYCNDFFNRHQFKEMHLTNEIAINYYYYYKEYNCENEQLLSFLEKPCRYLWNIVFTHNEVPIDTVEVFTSEKSLDTIKIFNSEVYLDTLILSNEVESNVNIFKLEETCVMFGKIELYYQDPKEKLKGHGISYRIRNAFICE